MRSALFVALASILFSAGACPLLAQQDKAEKARIPSLPKKNPPALVRTWTIISESGTVYQKFRFTRGPCQKVESWNHDYGFAVRKLTVQAAQISGVKNGFPTNTSQPLTSDCPPLAQWEATPPEALTLKDFDPAHLEYNDLAQRQIHPLTLNEGFQAVDQVCGMHLKKRQPALLKILTDFRFDVLFPQIILNERPRYG